MQKAQKHNVASHTAGRTVRHLTETLNSALNT